VPEPRRLGDILGGTLQGVAKGDQARAYAAWLGAVGADVAAATRPRRFARGTLTVGCESSVWANELTYLIPTILEKMAATDPDHPVKRLRFEAVGPPERQGDEASASNLDKDRRRLTDTELDEALRRSAELGDEDVRAAVRAALAAALGRSREDAP
jgi:predicted nucleic acid-binding Zn ribbon protein